MTEDDPEQTITSTKKIYAPVAFESKSFSPSQLKMSTYAKEFLAIYFAFMENGHILWGSTKSIIVLTDNKSVTRFFQTKMILPSLWNACDFVLQFHFKFAHVPWRMNTAADFLSRLDISPKGKVLLQIREDIQTTPIQVNIQSSDIHEEDQFYFLPEDDSETEEDICERKQRARKKKIYSPQEHQTDSPTATNETNSQTENLPLVCNYIQDPEQKQSRQLHNEANFPRSLRPHQDQDPVLRIFKLKILRAIRHPTTQRRPQSNKVFNPRRQNHHQRRTAVQTIFWRQWESKILTSVASPTARRRIHSTPSWKVWKTPRYSQNHPTMPWEVLHSRTRR